MSLSLIQNTVAARLGLRAAYASLSCGFLLSLSGGTAAETGSGPAPFQPNPGFTYRIESQVNGGCVAVYQKTVFLKAPALVGMYQFHWSFNEVSPGIFTIRNAVPGGVYLKSPAAAPSGITSAAKAEGEDAKWEIKRVLLPGGRDVGFFTVRNVKTKLHLAVGLPDDAQNKRHSGSVIVDEYKENSRNQLWSLERILFEPVEVLAVPQNGWHPNVLNKSAVLSSFDHLGPGVDYLLTGKGVRIKGKAIYWGKYWNDQHFYVINLNHPALENEGTYTLEARNKSVAVRITKQPYTRAFRRHGRDRFSLSDLFDQDYGFVGHWAHLSNWYSGLEPMGTTVRGWFDEKDWNKNKKRFEPFEPPVPITGEEARKAYVGGWDMTDQSYHAFSMDGLVLHYLSGLYRETSDPAVRQSIVREIIYGVNGLIENQEPDGSWRNRVADWTYWTGTSAVLGAGITSALGILREQDPPMAAKAHDAADRAWEYVSLHADDPTTWAIKGVGVLPDGTVISSSPQAHRHAYAGAYLAFAIQRHLVLGDGKSAAIAGDIIRRAALGHNLLLSGSGKKFPGENAVNGSLPFAHLYEYYPQAPADVQEKIAVWIGQDYRNNQVATSLFDGPFNIAGGVTNAWVIPSRLYAQASCYGLLGGTGGNSYTRGMQMAQRQLDWCFGLNPFYTSLVLGAGDHFYLDGWSSYHALGRHLGLTGSKLPQHPMQSSGTGYGGKETTPAGCILFWRAASMVERELGKPRPHHVALCGAADFRGGLARMTLGEHDAKNLRAHGLADASIRSLRVPENYEVTLYDQTGFSGKSIQLTSDVGDLASLGWADRTMSLSIVNDDTIRILNRYASASQSSSAGKSAPDNPLNGAFTSIGNQEGGWWKADFKREYTFKEIKIRNSPYGKISPGMQGICFIVIDDNGKKTWVSEPILETSYNRLHTITVPDVRGRYLQVSLADGHKSGHGNDAFLVGPVTVSGQTAK